MRPSEAPTFKLYTYFRSSCSARLRIALNLKSIAFEPIFIHLLKNEQFAPSFEAKNPSCSVPVLSRLDRDSDFDIGQSVAALEYLEEAFPECRSLLPPIDDPISRAKVRTLVNIIACDVQPVTNQRILIAAGDLGADKTEWARNFMRSGLKAYEATAKRTAGKYSVGNQITLADVCLVPAYWAAQRWFDVDSEDLPTVKRIVGELSREKAVIDAHWKNQPDTPPELAE